MRLKSIFGCVLMCLLLNACGTLSVKQLAKGDIDMVAEVNRHSVDQLVNELMVKLYKRNPRELKKNPSHSIASRQQMLDELLQRGNPLLIDGVEGVALLNRALEPSYQGDRVFMLVSGLAGMVHKSYGYRQDFYLFDRLNQQKLYHSARNIEVLAWRLRQSKSENGEPLLHTVSLSGPVINLSFERLLGKIIALQDSMALIAADENKRAINFVTHGLISMVFFPI